MFNFTDNKENGTPQENFTSLKSCQQKLWCTSFSSGNMTPTQIQNTPNIIFLCLISEDRSSPAHGTATGHAAGPEGRSGSSNTACSAVGYTTSSGIAALQGGTGFLLLRGGGGKG